MAGFQVKRYKNKHPDTPVLIADATKARQMEANADVKNGAGWIFSRRAVLMLTEDKLVCGDWHIPLNQIDSVSLLEVKQLFLKTHILKVQSNGQHYQFGLPYNPSWEEQTHFPLKAEATKLSFSSFSIITRIIAFLVIAWYIFQQFR